jgi:hypothetical protein
MPNNWPHIIATILSGAVFAPNSFIAFDVKEQPPI